MKGNLRRLLAIFLVLMLLSADICAIAEAVATLTLPSALQIIDEEAFAGNTSIDKVIVPDGTTEIRSRAFADSSMTELELPDSLTFIAEDAFEGCGEFALTVPENCYAYDRCVELGLIKVDEPDPSVIESVHPYPDDFDYTWTYDAGEGTESVTITFSADTETEEDYDFIYLYTLDNVQVGQYSGTELAGQSVTIDGTGFKLRLVSDEAWGVNEYYGFKLDSIVPKKAVPLAFESITAESSAVNAGEIIRWTVATTGGKAPIYYDYTVLLGEEEVATGTVEAPNAIEYTPVRAGEYKLSVIVRDSADAVLPAQVSDAVTVAPSTAYPESAHPYAANTDQSWVYAAEENVESLIVTFSEETKTQSNYDYIWIYNQYGAQIGKYSGTQLAGQTIEIMGSAFTIRLTSNGSTQYNGFTITNIEKYIPGPLGFVSLTADKTKAKTGDLITWTMETEGGRRPVTYEYTVTLNSETKYTGSVIRPEQITYVPMTAGDYTMSVVAKDDEGNELPAQTSTVRITERGETAAEHFTVEQTSGNFGKITAYTGSDTAVVIPSVIGDYTIESIGSNVFKNNTNIISVSMPDSLKIVGSYAFQGCTSLQGVKLNDGLESIYRNAFDGCSGLPSLYIPDTVTGIARYAFRNCSKLSEMNYPIGWQYALTHDNIVKDYVSDHGAIFAGTALKTLIIPEGITSIPDYAFMDCPNFTYFDLPDSIETIGAYAFNGCTGLSSMYLPDNITQLYAGTFKDCTNLKNVDLPSKLRIIGSYEFQHCTSLTDIELPSGLESIYRNAFYGCTSITTLYIPDSVTGIARYAFRNCSNLSEMNYPVGWQNALTHDNIVKDYVSDHGAIFAGTALKTLVIPEGISSIPDYAFKDCPNFAYFDLPDSITSIGAYAFNGCTGLSSMDLPDKITQLYAGTFKDCSGLVSIHLPSELKIIGSYEFQYCTRLESIELPDGLENIYRNAFDGCTSITSLYIPDTVTGIARYAFRNCSKLSEMNYPVGWQYALTHDNIVKDYISDHGAIFAGTALKTLVIPENVTSIPDYAFMDCPNFSYFNLPDSITEIGVYAFSGCSGLSAIEVPNKVTIASNGMCNECTNITSVILPEGITEIGEYAFNGNSNLLSVTIPESTRTVGKNAFTNCTKMNRLEINDNLQSIGWGAFEGCTSLTSVYLPDTIHTIDAYAFYNCSKLSEMNYPVGWTTANGGWARVFAGTALKTLDIPEGVTSIPAYAFMLCPNFEYFDLPNSLESIGKNAFAGCTGLTHLEIPEGVTAINGWLMENCTGLEDFILPDGLKTIGEHALGGCTSLKQINLPEGLETIGAHAFDGCSSLTSLYIPDSVSAIYQYAFRNCSNLCELNYPVGWSKADGGWARVFEGTALKTLVIPEGVTSIPAHAFQNCTNFTHFELPDSLQSIPAYAFAGCTNLEKIWIPEGIEPLYDEEGNQTGFVPIASTAFNNVSTSTMSIHGVSGSYAETFAAEKGYPFVAEAFEYTPTTLSGTVTDAAGNPLSGVTVTVYKGPTTNYPFSSTTTDSTGAWSMENVKVGSYYGVGFEKEGYTFSPALTGFTVADGGNRVPTAVGTPVGQTVSKLTLSVETWNCAAASSVRSVTVESDAAWEITSKPDWLNVYQSNEVEAASAMYSMLRTASIETDTAIEDNFLLITKDNEDTDSRSGEVVVTNGGTQKTIKVVQSGRGATLANGGTYTILSPVEGAEYKRTGIPLIMECATAASARVKFYLEGELAGEYTYNMPYDSAFWAMFDGNYSMDVVFYDASGNELKLSDGTVANPSVQFTLKQTEDDFYGRTQQLTFGMNGGTQSVAFENVAEMDISFGDEVQPDWLTFNYQLGNLKVTATANGTGISRSSTFSVVTDFGSKTIVVQQNASDNELITVQLSGMPEKGKVGQKLVSEATAKGGAGNYRYTFDVYRRYTDSNGVEQQALAESIPQSSNVLVYEVTDWGWYHVVCTVSSSGYSMRGQVSSDETFYDGQVIEYVNPGSDGLIFGVSTLPTVRWKANPDAVKYGVKIRNLTTNELLPSFGRNEEFYNCGSKTTLNLSSYQSEFAAGNAYNIWVCGWDEDGTMVVQGSMPISVGTTQSIVILSPASGSTLNNADMLITWDASNVTADYYDLYVYSPSGYDLQYTQSNAKLLPASTTELMVPAASFGEEGVHTIKLMAYANGVCVAQAAAVFTIQPDTGDFSPIWPLDNHYQINTLNYYEKLNNGGEHKCSENDGKSMYAAGIDIKVPENTAVRAVEDGTIIKIGTSFGLFIKIDHGDGHYSTYGHLNRVCVKNDGSQWVYDSATNGGTAYPVAQDYTMSIPVKKGDVIAYSGNTGGSTGAHLHLDVYQLVNGEWNKFSAWEKYYRSKYRTKLSYDSSVYNANNNKKASDSLSKSVVDWLNQYYEKNTSGIYEYTANADLPRVFSVSVSCADNESMAWVSEYSFVVETSLNAQWVGLFAEDGKEANKWSRTHSDVTVGKNPNNGNLIWTIKYGKFTRAGTRNLSFAAGLDDTNWSERVATGEFVINPETPTIVKGSVSVSPEVGTLNDELTISFITTADIPRVEIWAHLVSDDETVAGDYYPAYVLKPVRDAGKQSGISIPDYAEDMITASIAKANGMPNYQYWAWNIKIDPMHENFPTNLEEYTIKYKVVPFDGDGVQGEVMMTRNAAVITKPQTTFVYAEGIDALDATREAALLEIMEKYEGKTASYSTQIYMIEGYGSDLSVNGRGSAMCVVVKNGTLVFTNTSCATLPDQPFHAQSNPTLTNKNNKADWDDQPNVVDGVYPVGNVKHGNPAYPALEVKNNVVYRIHSKTCGGGTNGEIHSSKCGTTTSGGIHIHKKSSEECEIFTTDANGNNNGWVNSSGCAIIPTSAWNSFASAVGFTGGATVSNTCVVYDRRYAYENVPGFKAYMQEKYTDTEGYAFDAGYYDEAAIKAICGIQPGSTGQTPSDETSYSYSDYTDVTEAQIRKFIEKFPGSVLNDNEALHGTYAEAYGEPGTTSMNDAFNGYTSEQVSAMDPAKIIYLSCKSQGCNVVYLLATLQKEQGLFNNKWEYNRIFCATGYGVKDDDWETKYGGFIQQVYWCARQQSIFEDRGYTVEAAYEAYSPNFENAPFSYFYETYYAPYAKIMDEIIGG